MKIKTKHIQYIAPICIIAIFFFPSITHAAGWNPLGWLGNLVVGSVVDGITQVMTWFKGALSLILQDTITPLLNGVMSYQNFFSDGVNAGWKATRDFANLFFALILLFIAIATVLNTGGLNNYTAKNMLPKFIFAALFINFSKAIVGFLIDISQIIMISLYNTFGPTLTDSIGNASKIAEAGAPDNTDQAIISLLSLILVALLIAVFLWTTAILVIRIITLWFVIMLSPLAFVSSMIPGLSSLYNDWKTKLQEALITGPVLMFLLYLAVTVMNAGVNPNTAEDGNLLNNGNILNYVLVIGLVILANIQAMKAGQQGPPIISKAVGFGITAATFGVAGYMGAGGANTRQAFKNTKEYAKGGIKNADKLAGGLTNIAGAVGGVTRIKALQNANQKFESAKKDLKDRQARGVGAFKAIQGFSAEGKKQQLEDFEKQKAIRLFNEGKLEEKGNERYQKIAATLQATAATEVKDEYNVKKLGEQMEAALEEGDKFTAMALATRISELKGWNKIFTEGKYSTYSDPSNGHDTDAKQLDAFINDKFEIKDSTGAITESKTMNSFRSRQANILNDKGAGNFAAGLAERNVSDPNLSPSAKAAKAGLVGAGDMVAKNNSIFNRKSKVTDSSGREIYEDHFDISEFAPIIANESSLDTLEDPKSWNKYGGIRANIIKEINNYLSLYQSDPALARATYPALSVPEIGEKKLKAALKGLGGRDRITSSP